MNNECVDCGAFLLGCSRCSYRNDYARTIQCDVCDFGFFSLTVAVKPSASTLTPVDADSRLSMCVQKCEDFAYNYVSNRATMTCDYCGDSCSVCSSKYGCMDSYQFGHGYRSTTLGYTPVFPFSKKQPSTLFAIPERCKDSRCD